MNAVFIGWCLWCVGGSIDGAQLAAGRSGAAADAVETLRSAGDPGRPRRRPHGPPQDAAASAHHRRGTPQPWRSRRRSDGGGGRRGRRGGGDGGGSAAGRHSPLQDRTVSLVRRDRAVPLRRQVPVRARPRRTAAARPPPALSDPALPLVPRDRLLPVRIAMSFHPRMHRRSDRADGRPSRRRNYLRVLRQPQHGCLHPAAAAALACQSSKDARAASEAVF